MPATTDAVIAVEQLYFGYDRKQTILEDLNLQVPAGSIYGFLGANGAGKSTTIRAVLGLLKQRSGSVQVLGQKMSEHRLDLLSRIGSLIEAPSLYRHLSGYDNLKIACTYLGLPHHRINEVLEQVNLLPHARKISKKYSTGMKQRLGLALALLPDPELLILDEPTSGLDPAGIIEIRTILQALHAQGKTIFLSSHLLAEIEKIATQVGIIKNGQMIFQGTIGELEAIRTQRQQIRIVADDHQKAFELLSAEHDVQIQDRHQLIVQLHAREQIPALIEQLVAQQVALYEVSPERNDLEKLFINLTESNN